MAIQKSTLVDDLTQVKIPTLSPQKSAQTRMGHSQLIRISLSESHLPNFNYSGRAYAQRRKAGGESGNLPNASRFDII
jgi:hypothetical protein